MVELFNDLSNAEKIAVIAILVSVVGGLIKWVSSKKNPSIAAGDIKTGIDGGEALSQLVIVSKEAGQSKNEVKHLKQTVKQLEEQLASPQLLAGPTDESQTPQPTQEAKDIATQIQDDAGPYAQALKAIAEGDNEQADEFLDETQQFLDAVQEKKDQAQAKIYMARMQNASYAGKPLDALQYCDKLTALAGDDTLIMNNIALVYHNNAQYQKAEPLMKRVVEIMENPGGEPLPNYATSLNNLAELYRATNRLTEAEPLMKRTLTIDESSLGRDHPNVAIRLNNLAQLYQDTNRLKEAEPLMERALTIDEASYGKDHSAVAIDLNNLAQLYQATGRQKEAEPLMKRAMTIDESSLGRDHPDVAIDLSNLAQLYQATNRLTEAEPLYKRVVKIFEKSLGKDHPNVATALNNIAELYRGTNRLTEAEPLYKRALTIDESSYGRDHPKVARDLNNLALLYQDTGRQKEAEPLMKRMLEIFIDFTRRTGHRHPHLMVAFGNYVGLLVKMGDSQDQAIAKIIAMAPDVFNQ